MNGKIIFFSLLVLLIISGCKTKRAFDAITIKTGEISKTIIAIPDDFQQKELIILNRTVCSNEPFIIENSDLTKKHVTDNTFEYLLKEIEERAFFSLNQEIKKSSSFCSNTPFPVPLTRKEVQEHAAEKNIILSIEKIHIVESDNFRNEVESTFDKNNVLLSSRNVIIGKKSISGTAAIKLYDHNSIIMDSLIIAENYWYEVKGTNQLNVQRLLNQGRDLALVNNGKKIGFKIADAVSPYDIEIVRYYFAYSRTNSKFNIAQELISDDGDWQSASFVWQEITESDKDGTDRAKAFFNRGLYHEKNGEFDSAISMLEQATLLNVEVGGDYLSDLKKRYAGK